MNPTQEIYTSEPLPQTQRLMVKDEDVCLHCGLCAERCPTAAWDMRQFDLLIPYAGSGERGAAGGAEIGGAGSMLITASHRVATHTTKPIHHAETSE